MTGAFLSVPIMRPYHCWTVLHVSILAGLLFTLNADSQNSTCDIEIRVRRGTVHEAVLGEDLRINCPVSFCNYSPPTVSWYKYETSKRVPFDVSSSSHIKTEFTLLKPLEGISYLIFQQILRNDSGQYQCTTGGSMSHNINVSVHGDGERNVTRIVTTEGMIVDPGARDDLWIYMYFAAGIVPFVIIVIILSVVSMRGCKGRPKKELQTENQYMAIPMVEQPLPHARIQPSPRGTSRRSTRRITSPSQPNELPAPRDTEEEGSSIVYAALNHQLPARAAARPPQRRQEETSEYAAIRVKDPAPNMNYS